MMRAATPLLPLLARINSRCLPPSLRTLAAAALLALLAGCASAPPVPAGNAAFALPRQLHVVQETAGQPPLDTMLVVQREGAALRWSLFDPMGVPQARQMLEHGQWRNDGFLRPNAQARDLFAALMFAWTPQAELDAAYGAQAWRAVTAADGASERKLYAHGSLRWTVRWPQAAQSAQSTQSPQGPQGPQATPGDRFSITAANGVIWRIAPLKEQP